MSEPDALAWAASIVLPAGAHRGERVAAVLAEGEGGRRYVGAASRHALEPVRTAARLLLGLARDAEALLVRTPSVWIILPLEDGPHVVTFAPGEDEEDRLRDWIASNPALAELLLRADALCQEGE